MALQYFRNGPGGLPEADVAIFVHESADQIVAFAKRRDGIGENQSRGAYPFVGEEPTLIAEIVHLRLERGRIGQREIPVLSQ